MMRIVQIEYWITGNPDSIAAMDTTIRKYNKEKDISRMRHSMCLEALDPARVQVWKFFCFTD
jgi:hypothetical protein